MASKSKNMNTIKILFFAIMVLGYLAFGYHFLDSAKGRMVKYNCELAEISPDFPAEVKEECRKIRSGRI